MQIQLKYLAEEMQAISKGLEKVVQELTASENDGPVSENFCKVLYINELLKYSSMWMKFMHFHAAWIAAADGYYCFRAFSKL